MRRAAFVLAISASAGVLVYGCAGDPMPPSALTSSTSSTATRDHATSTSSTTTSAPAPIAAALDPSTLAAWSRVAVCEEGGWIGWASTSYPDSLGISAANWWGYGGGADLSPAAQIAVGQRIEAAAGVPGFVPDQHGCAAW
jgi:hypothetical protein